MLAGDTPLIRFDACDCLDTSMMLEVLESSWRDTCVVLSNVIAGGVDSSARVLWDLCSCIMSYKMVRSARETLCWFAQRGKWFQTKQGMQIQEWLLFWWYVPVSKISTVPSTSWSIVHVIIYGRRKVYKRFVTSWCRKISLKFVYSRNRCVYIKCMFGWPHLPAPLFLKGGIK